MRLVFKHRSSEQRSIPINTIRKTGGVMFNLNQLLGQTERICHAVVATTVMHYATLSQSALNVNSAKSPSNRQLVNGTENQGTDDQ